MYLASDTLLVMLVANTSSQTEACISCLIDGIFCGTESYILMCPVHQTSAYALREWCESSHCPWRFCISACRFLSPRREASFFCGPGTVAVAHSSPLEEEVSSIPCQVHVHRGLVQTISPVSLFHLSILEPCSFPD